MKGLLATDIFGRTDFTDRFCEELGQVFSSLKTISPYQEEVYHFSNEADAYRTYTEQCDHKKYESSLSHEIASIPEPLYLIGFSAGASAVWQAIGRQEFPHLVGFTGFYPGQIRNHLDLSPCCKSRIVFAREEITFDVREAVATLSATPKVQCEISPFKHGFLNPLSENYNQDAERKYLDRLKTEIAQTVDSSTVIETFS